MSSTEDLNKWKKNIIKHRDRYIDKIIFEEQEKKEEKLTEP